MLRCRQNAATDGTSLQYTINAGLISDAARPNLLHESDLALPADAALPNEISGCSCPDLTAAFQGNSWSDIPDSTIEHKYGSLPLFEAEAFQYDVPAYLHYAVRDTNWDSAVPKFLCYALDPDPFWEPRYTGLTNQQANTITEYLRLEVERLPNDEELKRAWEYWSAFAASTAR